jgi:F-type H+-transporting ATPase subunit b
MDLLTPSLGNIFWTSTVFLLLVILLKAFAWKPILAAIQERETNIADALNQAQLAKLEMQNLKAENDRIIKDAKIERDAILKEAREIKENMIAEAKDSAKTEGEKMIAQAKAAISTEKANAMAEIKSQIGLLSVNIAETLIKDKVATPENHSDLVAKMLQTSTLN